MNKKKSFLIVIIAVLLVVAIVVVVLFLRKPDSNSIEETTDMSDLELNEGNAGILTCKTKTDIESFAKKNSYKIENDNEMLWMSGVSLFDYNTDVEVYMNGDKISRICTYFYILDIPYPTDDIKDVDEDVEFDYIPHTFTTEEKQTVIDGFDSVKAMFEDFLGCGPIPYYDVVQTGNAVNAEDVSMSEDEQFYKGLIVREYSVRDSEGTLWLLRYSATDYSARASVIKLIDQTGFDGFMPIVDMTKK